MSGEKEKAQSYLGDLAGLQSKTERAERAILASAEDRLELVQKMIARAQVGVEGASDAVQDRYLSLIEERGKLKLVIAKCHKNLA